MKKTGDILDAKRYLCKFCSSRESTTIYNKIKDWEYGVEGEFSFVKCNNCAGIQIDPFPSLEELKKAYEVDYHGYEKASRLGIIFKVLYFFKDYFLLKKLARYVPSNSKALDVGCGSGEFLLKLVNLGVKEPIGIDFSENAMDILKSKNIKTFLGTFKDFECKKSYFDLIVMNNYLEHTVEPNFELKKSYDILKSGGWLIGEVPGFDSFERKFFKKYWGGNHVPRHTFQFEQQFLINLLKSQGFKNIEITHELNTGHIALSIQNYFTKNNNTLLKIVNGRTWLYSPLLLMCIPLNIIPILLKKSGVIKFYAQKFD